MPVYHMHIRTAGELIRDEEGYRCADLDAAMLEAIKGARSLMSADVVDGFLNLDQAIELHDAAGRHLSTLMFHDALRISQDPAASGALSTV